MTILAGRKTAKFPGSDGTLVLEVRLLSSWMTHCQLIRRSLFGV
jgi:hypothetical protein